MTKNLAEWKILNTYTLAQATLLMLGHDPGKWSQSKLIESPPPKFDLIFGKMIEDAKYELGYLESEEVEGKYFAEYKLMTYNPENITTRSRKDFLTTTSDRLSLNRWTKSFVTYIKSLEQNIDEVNFHFFDDDIKVEVKMSVEDKKLNIRLENNYLRLINDLAETIPGYDIKDASKSAILIRDNTDTKLSKQTLIEYLDLIGKVLEKDGYKF